MAEPQPERRSSRRFALRLPLTVTYPEGTKPTGAKEQTEAESRDVSARGICFYFDTAPTTGTDIEFTLVLPPEITATDSIHVHCKGRVVRVDTARPSGKMEVAAVIYEYEFLPEA
jgi:PilZ domain-containing protein